MPSDNSISGLVEGFSDICTNFHLQRHERNGSCKAYTDLVVSYRKDDKDPKELRLNLDDVLWNHNGKFHWGDLGEWTESVYEDDNGSKFDPTLVTRTLRLRDSHSIDDHPHHVGSEEHDHYRTSLHARLQLSDGSWRHSSIDLDQHIVVEDGRLVARGIRSRTIVLCFDGTGNEYDDTNTNVVYLMNQLQKADPTVQHVYYQAGIGTYVNGHWWSSVSASIAKTVDTMVAWSLDDHVRAGYKFLTSVYKPGDKISVFGFSRGAHTARAVVAMVNAVGLLPAHNEEHIPFAFTCYKKSATEEGSIMCKEFRQTFSQMVDVYFVGIWDTVNSTGVFPRVLPGTDENPPCKYFRHALALDERRVKFWPTVIQAPVKGTDKFNIPWVKQVWFPGNHCDVGGGNRPNKEGVSISNVPLRWMVKQCFECRTDITFVIQKLEHDSQLWDRVKQRALYIKEYLGGEKRANMPKNDWPRVLKPTLVAQAQNPGLYEWPRVRMDVDKRTGLTTIPADSLSATVDMHDTHNSLRHDTVFNLQWILMEILPNPVRKPQEYVPSERQKLKTSDVRHHGDHLGKRLYLKQPLTFVVNCCSGRNVYPESDGQFHLHESVRHLLKGPTGSDEGYGSVLGDSSSSERLLHGENEHSSLLDNGSSYEPAVSLWRPWTWWAWWTWNREVDHYECAAKFCVPVEDAEGKIVGFDRVYLEQLVKHHHKMITWQC